MTLTLIRSLWLWAGALALALLSISALGGLTRVVLALAVVFAVLLAWGWTGRRAVRQREALALTPSVSLPPADYRQPVVMVCGDGLDALFGAAPTDRLAVHMTEQGCYVRVAVAEQLPIVTNGLLAHRPHWASQLSVLFVVNPSEHTDIGVLAGQARAFRHQVALIRRRGIGLPLLLASYLPAARGEGPWFSWDAARNNPGVHEGGAHCSLSEWQQQASDLATCTARLSSSVQLSGVANWLAEMLLPHLVTRETRDPRCEALACGITLVPALPLLAPGNLWQQWLHDKTALVETQPVQDAATVRLAFPDPLLHLLPVQAHYAPTRHAGIIALWLFAGASVIALLGSTWQNNLLVRQVSDNLRRYMSVPLAQYRDQPEFSQREEAVAVLRQDAARLDDYYRHGEPLKLGFGLYRGERLRTPLLAVVTDHRQPPERPKPAEPIKIHAPVRLDSLSLFDAGSVELKSSSTKVLINALVGIKAQPGWLIVIAGHTDSTGNVEQNLQLSRARAAAVRDWMQRMGDVPDSCFAVQGFGASQPIASNDTDTGRAINRRVDIRLVPEVGACEPSSAGLDSAKQSPPMAEPNRKYPSHPAIFTL